MKDLKSFRLTLQESLEDDSTGKGSESRVNHMIGTLGLVIALFAALAIHCFTQKDLTTVITTIAVILGGSGAGPYAAKRVMEAFKNKDNTPPADPSGGAGGGDEKGSCT